MGFRKRTINPLKRIGTNYKRKATKSGHEFMYIAMWGEEVPKERKRIRNR